MLHDRQALGDEVTPLRGGWQQSRRPLPDREREMRETFHFYDHSVNVLRMIHQPAIEVGIGGRGVQERLAAPRPLQW